MTTNDGPVSRNRAWAAAPGCLGLIGLAVVAVLALGAFVAFENSEELASRSDNALEDGMVGAAAQAAEERDESRLWALESAAGASCCCLGSVVLLGICGFLLVRK